MEVTVVEADNIPDSPVLDIRVGPSWQHGALEVNRPLRMPDPGSTHPVEVGVFERLASISLPQQESAGYQEVQIPLPTSILGPSTASTASSSSSSSTGRVKLRLKASPYADRIADEVSLSGSLCGSTNREADDVDRLVDWFQDMVTTLLRDQPSDPIGVLLAELKRKKQETAAQLSTLIPEEGPPSNCAASSGSQGSTTVPAGDPEGLPPSLPTLQQQLQHLQHEQQLQQQQQPLPPPQPLPPQPSSQQAHQPDAGVGSDPNIVGDPGLAPGLGTPGLGLGTSSLGNSSSNSNSGLGNSNSISNSNWGLGTASSSTSRPPPEPLPQPCCLEMPPDALAPKPKPRLPHQPPPGKAGRGALGLGLAKGSRPREVALGQVAPPPPPVAGSTPQSANDPEALLQAIASEQSKAEGSGEGVPRSNSQLAARWSVSLILKGSACQAALEESLREQARQEASKTLAKSVIGGVCGKLLREAAGSGLSRSPSRSDRKFSFVGRPSLSITDTAESTAEDTKALPTPIVSLGIDRNSWGQWLSRS